jgi:phenylacetate-coenzyme A ligase PaaK-like adenylate-forming protein
MNLNWRYPEKYYEKSLDILETALNRVPAYEDWKKFDPGRDKSVDERFKAMPFLHKTKIRDYFPDGLSPEDIDVTAGLENGEIGTAVTSGSSDISVTNIWNQKWWDASEKASWKLNSNASRLMTGSHPEAILANPRNVGIISDNTELPMEQRRISRFLFLNEMTDPAIWSSSHMDRIIEELKIFKPAVLEANPSFLARLCRYAAENNRKVYQPGLITFTYEYPSQLHYRQIRRVFSSPTASSYGSTETGYVFMQCEEGKFHQNTDFCRVDLQPFKQEYGGPFLGRILVTTFDNPWYYMLRFDVRDLVRVDEEGTCKCGRKSGLILSAMEGRAMSVTLTCDGRPVTLRALDDSISTLDGIEEYQLHQLSEKNYNLYLVSLRSDKKLLSEEAVNLLKKLYGEDAAISVFYKDALSPEDSGKYSMAKANFPIDIEKFLDLD